MDYRKSLGFILVLTVIVSIFHASRMTPRMIACDVGQGDAIIITSGSVQMLVDGGPSGARVLSCLGKYLPFWDRKIEAVVMTNSDRDHIGGLADVIGSYEVGVLLTADGIKGTATFRDLLESIKQVGVEVEVVEMGDFINMGDKIEVSVIWPVEVSDDEVASLFVEEPDVTQVLGDWDGGEINERSVGMIVRLEESTVLMMADLGEESEDKLLELDNLYDIDVIKVGHHGSKYSTTKALLDKVKPEIGVISVGENNYGHPTSEVIERLSGAGVRLYRTDERGDVVINF